MAEKKVAAKKKPATKDPKGGLTAAGRAEFKKKTGANLKPGVIGTPKTPEEIKRKGSFLRRHFANPAGPMQDDKGEPTRLALSAQAWGEKVPKTDEDARKLAAKGERLLKQYKKLQAEGGEEKKPAGKKPVAKTPATKKKAESKS